MTLQSKVDAVLRWSNDLSLFHFLLIKEKWHGIQKRKRFQICCLQVWILITPLTTLVLAKLLSFFTPQHLLMSNVCNAVMSITWNHVNELTASQRVGVFKDWLSVLVLLLLIRALVASACPLYILLSEVKWESGWFCGSKEELAKTKSSFKQTNKPTVRTLISFHIYALNWRI